MRDFRILVLYSAMLLFIFKFYLSFRHLTGRSAVSFQGSVILTEHNIKALIGSEFQFEHGNPVSGNVIISEVNAQKIGIREI